MSKLLYKPLSLTAGVLGGVLAGVLFKQLWKVVAGKDEPPEATDFDYGWGEVLTSAALQGAIFAVVKAAIDRGGARGLRSLTGDRP